MSIEKAINDVIIAKLEEGIIERLVAENLEKGVNKALEDLFGSYGDATKAIQAKIKGVILPRLEGFDYSNYIAKLDCVLVEILNNTTLDHKKILGNFVELMTDNDILGTVKVSEIFDQYIKFVAQEVDTDGLNVNCEGEDPEYESVTVTMTVEHDEGKSWASFKFASILFECEHDEKVNYELRLSKFLEYPWSLSLEIDSSIRSLRHLDSFKIYLLKLLQAGAKIEIDTAGEEDQVTPDKEPEVSFS